MTELRSIPFSPPDISDEEINEVVDRAVEIALETIESQRTQTKVQLDSLNE